MSCALDPRFKNLPFLNDKSKNQIKEKLKEMINNLSQISDDYQNTSVNIKRPRLSGNIFIFILVLF